MSNKTLPSSVLNGGNPTHYDSTNPIVVFIIQAVVVIVFCRILHFPLQRLRQPRVIAEVIGGILLGPTAFGRIHGFTNTIFPKASMPSFNLIANVGLILFLFIVGLEVDLRHIQRNARVALSVGTASLALPFGFGCLLAWALHREYAHLLQDSHFGIFLLFIGTAFSITAFPVLARILTELKLLRRDVGVVVLAAGVGNDVVGWILLALTVALVNSSTGLTAFYVILLVVAWCLLLFFAVKPAYAWIARRSSNQSGPSDTMLMLTILLVLVSSFYTEIIGVHPIFGAFLVGLIIPHENGYAVALGAKIDDLVSVLFLPLYFASSGLKTNIGLLNDGKAWGYTIAIIICATFSKVAGSMIAARMNGFLWRESLTVGTLMSCKGLVELIVLNVGLSAGILDTKLFTMFVVMALVTTFMTTPLTMWFFPPWYQDKVAKWRSGECDWDGNKVEKSYDSEEEYGEARKLGKVMIVVNRIEGLASLMKITHFLSYSNIELSLMRILELTDRLSQMIMVSEFDDLLQQDSLISIFKTLTRMVGIKMSYSFQVLASSEYAAAIEHHAEDVKSELVIVPWIHTVEGEWHDNAWISSLIEHRTVDLAVMLDESNEVNASKSDTRRRALSMSSILSRNLPDAEEIQPYRNRATKVEPIKPDAEKVHLYLPIFSFGADERLALLFMIQLLKNKAVSANIVVFRRRNRLTSETSQSTDIITREATSKVQFSVAERTNSQSIEPELKEVDAMDQEDLERLRDFMQGCHLDNSNIEVVDSETPLMASISRLSQIAMDKSQASLLTILTRAIGTSRGGARPLTANTSGTASPFSFERSSMPDCGAIVEGYVKLHDRPGGIVIIQAKHQ